MKYLFDWKDTIHGQIEIEADSGVEAERLFSTQRLAVFGYLLGAPIFLKFTGVYWLSAMRVITDRLAHVI